MRGSMVVALVLALSGASQAGEAVVAYEISNGREINESLTGGAGDPARGRALYAGEARAGCPACHGMQGRAEASSGPDLSGIAGRMTAGAVRLWIVAPEAVTPGTEMPAFYAEGQRRGAADPLHGGPALTAAEIEDLVAYLLSI